MVAALDDTSLVQNDDFIGMHQGTQAMGDDDGGLAGCRLAQCLSQPVFRSRIHGRCRIVQQQDRRFGHHPPRDGETLTLPARQAYTPLPDKRVICFRQALHIFVNMCGRGCFNDTFLLGLRIRIGDIFGNTVVKQKDVLLHRAHSPAQR